MSHYHKTNRRPLLGDDTVPAEPVKIGDIVNSPNVKIASGIALTYHGYRRTKSILWALVYGMLGKWKPAIAVPVAVAQGYGKPKNGSPTQLTIGGGS